MDHGHDPQFYTTQYELLKSRALAERVVSALALTDDAEFLRTKKTLIVRIFGEGSAAEKDRSDPERRRMQASAAVRAGAQIQPVPGSRIVKVLFNAATPALAQRIADGLADNFVAMTLDRRFNASAYARSFLEEKLAQLKVKLEESERMVVAYAQKEGIVNVDEKLSVAGANLRSLNEVSPRPSPPSASASRSSGAKRRRATLNGLQQLLEDRLIQMAREKRAQLDGRLSGQAAAGEARLSGDGAAARADRRIRPADQVAGRARQAFDQEPVRGGARAGVVRFKKRSSSSRTRCSICATAASSIIFFSARWTPTARSMTGCCNNIRRSASAAASPPTMCRSSIGPRRRRSPSSPSRCSISSRSRARRSVLRGGDRHPRILRRHLHRARAG